MSEQNDYRRKIKSQAELLELIGPRPRKKSVIMCHGTFDVVHPGLAAKIRLTSFNSRSVAPVDGRVLSVSADSMADRRTGQDYYLARIEIDENAASALGGKSLYPGMPAEVLIVVGERTMLDYFLAPLTRSFNRAFREE